MTYFPSFNLSGSFAQEQPGQPDFLLRLEADICVPAGFKMQVIKQTWQPYETSKTWTDVKATKPIQVLNFKMGLNSAQKMCSLGVNIYLCITLLV